MPTKPTIITRDETLNDGIVPAGTIHDLTFRLMPPDYEPGVITIPKGEFQPGRVKNIQITGVTVTDFPYTINLEVKSPHDVLSSDDIRAALKRMIKATDTTED